MEKISGVRVKDIIGGGAIEGGNSVYFTLALEGGEAETFVCDGILMPKLFGNLAEYASIAEAVRVKQPGRTVGAGAPYIVEKVVRSAHTLDGKRVVVELDTNQGFPLQIAMTMDQAAQTIEFLQREMLLVRTGKRQKPS